MSAAPAFDPRRLDVAAFARAGAELAGTWPLAEMPRLLQDTLPPPDGAATVAWAVRGSSKPVAGGEPELRLHLHAGTTLRMCCQRCLQPVTVVLDVRPSLRFVRGEAQAEALDEAGDEDVLALTAALDLRQLVEDELILALPLVPRHETCAEPLPMSAGDDAATAEAPSPAFATLASLLRDSPGKPN